eukprot:4914784-Prorocentrum_lima.AAC.1
MNSTFSWTGDLGVESKFCKWHNTMLELMGPWVRESDLDQVAADRDTRDGDAQGFAFEDEDDGFRAPVDEPGGDEHPQHALGVNFEDEEDA